MEHKGWCSKDLGNEAFGVDKFDQILFGRHQDLPHLQPQLCRNICSRKPQSAVTTTTTTTATTTSSSKSTVSGKSHCLTTTQYYEWLTWYFKLQGLLWVVQNGISPTRVHRMTLNIVFPKNGSFLDFFVHISSFQNNDSPKMSNRNVYRWLDSNHGPLVLQATARSTAPQPLPNINHSYNSVWLKWFKMPMLWPTLLTLYAAGKTTCELCKMIDLLTR